MLMTAMLMTAVSVVLPRMAEQNGLTMPQMGVLVSSQFVGYTVSVLAGGILSDRYGKIPVLRIAMAGHIVTSILFFYSSGYALALAACTLSGVFCGVLENNLTAAVYMDPARGVRKAAFLQFMFSAGAAVTPIGVLLCGAAGLSWKAVFPAMAAAMGVCAAIGATTPRPAADTGKPFRQIAGEFAQVAKEPVRLAAPAAMFLYVSAEVGLWGFLPAYVEARGGDETQSMLCGALLWVCMAASRLIISKADFGIRRSLLVSASLGIVGMILVITLDGNWVLAAGAFSGFAIGPMYSLIIAWATKLASSRSAGNIAFSMSFGTLGPALTGALSGFLGRLAGAGGVLILPIASMAALIILLSRVKTE